MERQATFSDVDEMLYNAFNTESPDGEADAEVASDTTEDPGETAALPEPEGAAENDDTDTRRPSSKQSKEKSIIDLAKVVVEGVAGKDSGASKLIEQAEKTYKKGAKLGAKAGKSARRFNDAQAERRSFKKKCTAILKEIKRKKIGQTVEDFGQGVSTVGDVVLLAAMFNPEACAYLLAVGGTIKASGRAIETAGPSVQKATDVSINANKRWKNKDYKFGDVAKGFVRDLRDLDLNVSKVCRILRKMGSRKSPQQAGG